LEYPRAAFDQNKGRDPFLTRINWVKANIHPFMLALSHCHPFLLLFFSFRLLRPVPVSVSCVCVLSAWFPLFFSSLFRLNRNAHFISLSLFICSFGPPRAKLSLHIKCLCNRHVDRQIAIFHIYPLQRGRRARAFFIIFFLMSEGK